MPSRATHVEARLAELPVGHPRQRENFHRTQVLKPTEMAFPHSPPTRHCTQMHPLSLQLAVALLPPSRSHRVGMEGRHSVDQAHVEVRPAELRSARLRSAGLRVPQLRRPKLQRQLSRGGGVTPVFPWPRSHTTPSCAAPSSGSRGGISSSVLSPSSSRPVSITSCAPTLGAWGACLAEALPICRGSNGGE